MKLVIQNKVSDCGITYVAMIASQPYQSVIENYSKHFPSKTSFYTYGNNIRDPNKLSPKYYHKVIYGQ